MYLVFACEVLTHSQQGLVVVDVLCGKRRAHPEGEWGQGQARQQTCQQELQMYYLLTCQGSWGVHSRNQTMTWNSDRSHNQSNTISIETTEQLFKAAVESNERR